MLNPPAIEALISDTNRLLIKLSHFEDEHLITDFCGSILTLQDLKSNEYCFKDKTIYLCGDLNKLSELDLTDAKQIFAIQELTHGYDTTCRNPITLGQVPLSVHGLGVFYRRFFDLNCDYFKRICEEHAFQSLTESTKSGTAHRTGIYVTLVKQIADELHFHLLRCSTNLSGPTENVLANDMHIINALNQEAEDLFSHQAPLNHVLAQIYHNTPANTEKKQSKAKISAHADKTKDMPSNGIMAFCTFYDQLEKLRPMAKDPFDYGYKETSGLTRLHFRLKEPHPTYPAQFSLTLYPNSVFFMPLSTNRLYTHEIQSSILNAEWLPTRLGYVVRCSSTEAVHKQGQTYLKKGKTQIKLEPPTNEGMQELRALYALENKTQNPIHYGEQFCFSMNQGDYLAPKYKATDEFRVYQLPIETVDYARLFASVNFEDLGKGRKGSVLIKPDEAGHFPIVRTTTGYKDPAQCFEPIHDQIAQQIQKTASLPVDFNNALIEAYTKAYSTMGSHSDQALDLADESFIALFSCYQYPERKSPLRRLIVEPKETGSIAYEIPLQHNSVVVFSVDTNRRHKHKIVLDTQTRSDSDNPWLGLTFRTSKTSVRFRDGQPYFLDDTCLHLANDEQQKEFFQLRRRENQETDFSYPRLTYTISASDRYRPEALRVNERTVKLSVI